MTTIVFKKATATNFRSYREIELEFREGIHFIRGNNQDDAGASSNGSGKTTLIDLPYWVLTGNSLKNMDSVDDVINLSAGKDCMGKLELEIVNGSSVQSVEITRYRGHSKGGNGITIMMDGQSISAHRVSDNQKIIDDIIQIEPKLLRSVIMLDSKLSGKFSGLTPSQRVDMIESIRDYSLWSSVRSDANIQLGRLKKKIEECRDRINSITGGMQVLVDEITKIDKDGIIHSERLVKAESGELVGALRDSILGDEMKIVELNSEIAELNTEYNSLVLKWDTLAAKNKSEAELVRSLSESHSNLKSELRALEKDMIREESSMKDSSCSQCGTVLSCVSEEHKAAVRAKVTAMEVEIAAAESELAELDSKLKKARWDAGLVDSALTENRLLRDSARSKIASNTTKVSDITSVMATRKSKLAEIDSLITSIKITIENGTAKKTDFNKQIEDMHESEETVRKEKAVLEYQWGLYNHWYEALGPKGSFRPILLANDVRVINTRLDYISRVLFSDYRISLSIPSKINRNIDIEFHGPLKKKMSQLSDGEMKRVDLAIQFAIYDLVHQSSSVDTNLCGYDEIFDSLDAVGLERVMELLQDRFQKGDCLMIISHNEALKSMVLSHINVAKKDDISYLEPI
jgi:DNA repair exonuclease SbcCD ATPase subunit